MDSFAFGELEAAARDRGDLVGQAAIWIATRPVAGRTWHGGEALYDEIGAEFAGFIPFHRSR